MFPNFNFSLFNNFHAIISGNTYKTISLLTLESSSPFPPVWVVTVNRAQIIRHLNHSAFFLGMKTRTG